MISVNIDKEAVDEIVRAEIKKTLNEITHRHTFWDFKELCRQTNMSSTFIKEHFFFDPRFPKYRVGRKWLMPARETEEFLLVWLKEQRRY